jgi:glycosyltransferase involved in cell wall biosynthesis
MSDGTIIFVTSHATKGGTLDYIQLLKKGLESEGYQVHAVSLYRGDSKEVDGVNLILDRERIRLRDIVPMTLRFVASCRATRPFVIIGVMPLANIIGALASRLCGASSIATHHSPTEIWQKGLSVADRLMARLGFYDRVVCVSKAVAASFRHGYAESFRASISTIANGAKDIKPEREAAEVRRSLGLAEGEAFVLMVGRLVEQKNVLAAARAVEITSNIRLVIAGEGPLRPALEKISPSKIKLLGEVNRQAVADLLHSCDAFMQVSLYEGHSLALLEAIRARRPLIVSSAPSQVEAVRMASGAPAALICDPLDVEGIARAMMAAVFDWSQRDVLLQGVHRLAEHVPAEAEMLRAYSSLIRSINQSTSDAGFISVP